MNWKPHMDRLREILIEDKDPTRRVANLFRAGIVITGKNDSDRELLFHSLVRRFGVRHPAVCEVGNLTRKLRVDLLGGISDQLVADAMRGSIMLYLLTGLDGWTRDLKESGANT